MKKIDNNLESFLKENGLNYEWRVGEHSGCWDKGCSHPVNELNIWKGNVRKYSFTFEEGCSTEMIIETLTDRLKEAPFNKL